MEKTSDHGRPPHTARSFGFEVMGITGTRDWVEKSVMDIHAILEIPKGAKHPRAEVTELLKKVSGEGPLPAR